MPTGSVGTLGIDGGCDPCCAKPVPKLKVNASDKFEGCPALKEVLAETGVIGLCCCMCACMRDGEIDSRISVGKAPMFMFG